MYLVFVGVITVLVLGGCAVSTGADTSRSHEPVWSGAVPIDDVALSAGRQQARVDFAGAKEFDADNPCSAAYRGTAEIDGEELVIGIYAEPHPLALPSGVACEAMGYSRSLKLDLPAPFAGSQVRDLSGQVLLLDAPDGMAVIGGLPKGWNLHREESIGGSMTPRWMRIYSEDADPWPSEGDSTVTLVQSFGGPVDTTGAELQPSVHIGDTEATFYLHTPTGEMVLVWPIGSGEVALAGYLNDFSRDEFIALAGSVSIPIN